MMFLERVLRRERLHYFPRGLAEVSVLVLRVCASASEPLTSFPIDKIVLAVVSAHQNPLHVGLRDPR